MLDKRAFSPSDIINGIQTIKNSRQAGGVYAQHYGDRATGFARDVEKAVRGSHVTNSKLNAALDATAKASGDISDAARNISAVNPKKLARNITIGGLGLAGTGLLWHHMRKVREGDERMMKEASLKEFGKELAFPLAINAGSMGIAAGINYLVDKRSKSPDKLWANFVGRFPEFKNDARARESFDVMVDFNPSAAKHPIVVKNFLENSVYGGEDVNVNVINNLADIEAKRSRTESDRAKRVGDAVSAPLADIANTMRDYGSNNLKEQIERARNEGMIRANRRTPIELQLAKDQALLNAIRINKEIGNPWTENHPELLKTVAKIDEDAKNSGMPYYLNQN